MQGAHACAVQLVDVVPFGGDVISLRVVGDAAQLIPHDIQLAMPGGRG
jgi:hypothetical protein